MIKIHVVVDSPKWRQKKIKNIDKYFKLKQRKFNYHYNSRKALKSSQFFLTNNSGMKIKY